MIEKLLENNHKNKISVQDGLIADHFPMVIQALSKLKATDDKLLEYTTNKLSEIKSNIITEDSKIVITHANWKDYLGKRLHTKSYVQFFSNELENNNLQIVLDWCLPELISGIGAAAFHGLIRLAYALELNLTSEIAHALASWSCSYEPLGKLPQPGQCTLEESYLKVREMSLYKNEDIPGGNITQRMISVSKNTAFSGLVANLDRTSLDLSDLAGVAIILYLSSKGNFTAIHGVTSCHALRVLMQFMDSKLQRTAMGYFWQALLAAIITIKSPPLDISPLVSVETSWSEIIHEALNSNDDHLIKLVYSSYEESKVYDNKLYLEAAYRKVFGFTK